MSYLLPIGFKYLKYSNNNSIYTETRCFLYVPYLDNDFEQYSKKINSNNPQPLNFIEFCFEFNQSYNSQNADDYNDVKFPIFCNEETIFCNEREAIEKFLQTEFEAYKILEFKEKNHLNMDMLNSFFEEVCTHYDRNWIKFVKQTSEAKGIKNLDYDKEYYKITHFTQNIKNKMTNFFNDSLLNETTEALKKYNISFPKFSSMSFQQVMLNQKVDIENTILNELVKIKRNIFMEKISEHVNAKTEFKKTKHNKI